MHNNLPLCETNPHGVASACRRNEESEATNGEGGWGLCGAGGVVPNSPDPSSRQGSLRSGIMRPLNHL